MLCLLHGKSRPTECYVLTIDMRKTVALLPPNGRILEVHSTRYYYNNEARVCVIVL